MIKYDNNNVISIALVALGFLSFSVGDTIIKFLVGGYPKFVLLFWGSLASFIVIMTYGMVTKGLEGFKTKSLKFHVMRGCCGFSVALLNMFALKSLQLDVFYAIVFTGPLWVTLVCRIFLKDCIGKHRLGALILGFIVVVYMLRPDGGILSMGAVYAFMSVIFFAFAMLSVRFMPKDESRILFPLATPMVILLISTPYMIWNDLFTYLIEGKDMLLIFGSGFCFSFGSACTAIGFHRATTSAAVAPIQYTQMVWGVLFGYLVFGNEPMINSVIGAALLAGIGIYMIRHEALQPKSKEI